MAEVRMECESKGMRRFEARDHAWKAALAAFPPAGQSAESLPEPDILVPIPAGGQVQGLGEIPAGWPALPNNASLQAELGWVQAERLRVVEEKSSGSTLVRLGRASTPAPSMAALGWLETSIRSYAKYVDILARALSTVQDDQDHVRRERMRLDEIQGLLDEMHRDDSAPLL